MNKREIIDQLKTDIYCRLAPSEHGIGVIAIRDIPKGINPFIGSMPGCIDFVGITPEELEGVDDEVVTLVKDFCPLQEGEYQLPDSGIASIDVSYYLNHSDNPNMTEEDEGENFIASRDIKKGEFLTVDYTTYDEQIFTEEWYKEKKITEIMAGEGHVLHRIENDGC